MNQVVGTAEHGMAQLVTELLMPSLLEQTPAGTALSPVTNLLHGLYA